MNVYTPLLTLIFRLKCVKIKFNNNNNTNLNNTTREEMK